MSLNTTKFFANADSIAGDIVTGADFVCVIEGYEELTIDIKTTALPLLKAEKIEFTTIHGVKTERPGYVQTLQLIPMTLMIRDNVLSKNRIEDIVAGDDNGKLTIHFYFGRNLVNSKLWGTMEHGTISIEDNPDADSESTTTPLTMSISISGHYSPKPFAAALDLSQNVLSRLN